MSGGGDNTIPETPAYQTMVRVARASMDDYNARWKPVENYYVDKTHRDLGAQRTKAEGQAASETRSRFSGAIAKTEGTLTSQGAKPGSGRNMAGLLGLSKDEEAATGNNMSEADNIVESNYAQTLKDIVSLGRGQAGAAMTGITDAAATAQRTAGEQAQLSEQQAEGTGRVIGEAAGAFTGMQKRSGLSNGGSNYKLPSNLANFNPSLGGGGGP